MKLKYDIAYHLHCELELRSGRTISLEALDQRRTYSGLLGGLPIAELNDWNIQYAVKEAEHHCAPDAKPYLLPPPRRDYFREPGDMAEEVARWPQRPPEWLPPVLCIGTFKDVLTIRDPAKDWSQLTVVWYQTEYALPILEPALSQILAVDWESLAVDN